MQILEICAAEDEKRREALLDQIAALDERVFADSRWGREAFSENVRNEYDFLAAAVEASADGGQEQLLGYGLLRGFDDAEVLMIASDPAHRKQGVGRSLLDALLKHAKECGIRNVFLEVRESNEAARTMYEHAGFTIEGIRKRYYHDPLENAVIMRFTW